MFNERKQYNKMFKDEEPKLEGTNTDIVVTDEREETPTPPASKELIKVKVVNCKKLNVRKAPNSNGDIGMVVDVGTELLVDDINDGWAKVRTESGIAGYVMDKFIM